MSTVQADMPVCLVAAEDSASLKTHTDSGEIVTVWYNQNKDKVSS
jgi:hypothetical protein